MSEQFPTLSTLAFPYADLRPLGSDATALREVGRSPGSALVWSMSDIADGRSQRLARQRPGGMALIVVLPCRTELESSTIPFVLHGLRPHGILPFHPKPTAGDLRQVLRRPPVDLPAEVTDYLRWRGLVIDRDTIHLIRRLLDLSSELRSIASVSRSLYMSRRALGRRLMTRGLPVPSHWLHMGRLLRVAIRLQNSDTTISSVAYEHGYPDAFSLSNQMERLLGYRPSEVRRRYGWEWLVEAWLRKEADTGRLTAAVRTVEPPVERPPVSCPSRSKSSPRATRRQTDSAQ